MPRPKLTRSVVRLGSGAPASGTVSVCEDGTNDPLQATLYSDDDASSTLANPFTFTDGLIQAFLDAPQRVRLIVTPEGSTQQVFDHVDVFEPAGGGYKHTQGPGKPSSTAGRSIGDTHFDTDYQRELVLVAPEFGGGIPGFPGGGFEIQSGSFDPLWQWTDPVVLQAIIASGPLAQDDRVLPGLLVPYAGYVSLITLFLSAAGDGGTEVSVFFRDRGGLLSSITIPAGEKSTTYVYSESNQIAVLQGDLFDFVVSDTGGGTPGQDLLAQVTIVASQPEASFNT